MSPDAPPSARRGALVFVATAGALWLLFAVIAAWAPPLLDDWYQLEWLGRHQLTVASVLAKARDNYLEHNPRLGETFLLLQNGSRALHIVLTASVELGLLCIGYALAFGRWPRARARDAAALLVLQALVWTIAPRAGAMYFYRPFTTNYVIGLCLQLLLLVPYRRALEAAPGGHRPGRAAALLVLGWAAGMSNEHTGPTAIVAVAVLVVVLARRAGGVRAWTLAGLCGLVTGYAMLFFAPGQALRYAGAASHAGPLEVLRERGLAGAFTVVLEQVRHARAALLVLAVVVLVALLAAARRGAPPPTLDRRRVGLVAAFLAGAGLITATLAASPLLGERLYFAPSVLVALALLLVVDALVEERAARRLVAAFTALVVVGYAGAAIAVHATTYRDAQARARTLRATPPGTVATIAPFTYALRTPWGLGDDLRPEYLRAYVAHEIYGLAGIEYDRLRQDLQPTIPWRIELDVTLDPPLAAAALWRAVPPPLHYVPSRVDRLVAMLRELVPALQALAGHRLLELSATVHGLDVPELAGRPVLAARWRGGVLAQVESELRDPQGAAHFVLFPRTLPAGVDELLLVACGRAVPLTPRPVAGQLRADFTPWCVGHQALVACAPATCWMAGRAFY